MGLSVSLKIGYPNILVFIIMSIHFPHVFRVAGDTAHFQTAKHVCMYVCMYVCTYVRMYVCRYVRMYVCT